MELTSEEWLFWSVVTLGNVVLDALKNPNSFVTQLFICDKNGMIFVYALNKKKSMKYIKGVPTITVFVPFSSVYFILPQHLNTG